MSPNKMWKVLHYAFNKNDVAKGDRSPKKNVACVKGPWCCDANVVK